MELLEQVVRGDQARQRRVSVYGMCTEWVAAGFDELTWAAAQRGNVIFLAHKRSYLISPRRWTFDFAVCGRLRWRVWPLTW